MSRRKHSAEAIIAKLREAEILQSKGMTILEMSDRTDRQSDDLLEGPCFCGVRQHVQRDQSL
jgi:hypothetical protein